jgi:chromosome segregation protein
MRLKTLELSGFKSFAKKTRLEFLSPITAIVGPNGSGKSNTTEGLRFVLGEQSLKSMRGKRGEDLIWNGSHSLPRANRASVRIIFSNESRLFNLDIDEVILERNVYRDGVNEYVINGTRVRHKDLNELLAGVNMSSSGHHIISQGEADRILNANAKERRAMIEDALGLKIYHLKKQESERRLQKTRENIKQVEALRREISPHLKFLKKQVDKLARAEALRESLTERCLEFFKREHIYLIHEKSLVEMKLGELRHRLEEVKVCRLKSDDSTQTREIQTLREELAGLALRRLEIERVRREK